MPSSCLRGKERAQQVWSVCLIRILTEVWLVHVGNSVCHTVAWLHLAWVGVFASIPPTPWFGHAHTRAFWPTWDWHGEASNCEHGNIHYTWTMVACFDCAWWERASGWPPSHRLGHAHKWSAHTRINFNHNLKLNLKHILKLLSMVTFSYLCLCTQLATSFSPQRLNFKIF